MCGIAGLVPRRPPAPDVVPRLWEALAHRGPDDRGFCVATGDDLTCSRDWDPSLAACEVLLVHTRLSIIDLTERGWQPMTSADGRYVVIFNGEIYNYRELRKELEGQGQTFKSDSDTEVLIEAYAKWGQGAFARFVGMFALAIFDRDRGELVLARDPFGIKPLLYADDEAGFVFGSNLASIFSVLPPPYRVNQREVFEYLRWGLTDHVENSLIAGVKHLLPGHYLRLSLRDGSIEQRRFWELELDRQLDVSFPEAVELVRDAFLRSIDLHLRSDVPLGSALSGGLDSSSIVMAMRHVGGGGLDLRTFSFRSGDARDEGHWIDLVNRAANAKGHAVSPDGDLLASDLEALVRHQGEPFTSTSIMAQWWVFRIAQESGMKVMLDGQGADEIFGGYRTDLPAMAASLLRQGRVGSALRFSRAVNGLDDMSHRRLWTMVGEYVLPGSWQAMARRLVGREMVPAALSRSWWADGELRTETRSGLPRRVMRHNLARGIAGGLPKLLRYEDRNSMAFSIESRVPFLTPEIAQLALSLPEQYLISGDATSKYALREAMRGIVPPAVLDRRDKIGFATPEAEWLLRLKPWMTRVANSEAAGEVGALDMAAVRRLLDGIGTDTTGRDDALLWRCVNLVAWSALWDIRF